MGEEHVDRVLNHFALMWPQERIDYRRPEDRSWKAYALALRNVVRIGAAAIAPLTRALFNPNRQVRALCARALGFLGALSAVQALTQTLKDDPWETVRLLAADSLGMIAGDTATSALEQAVFAENNADVLLHINIALERDRGLEPSAVEALLGMEEEDLDRAVVGTPAPEFELETPTGERFSLEENRNKRAALLVFISGDG